MDHGSNNDGRSRTNFPDAREMDAAFDMSDEEDDDDVRADQRGLLSRGKHVGSQQQEQQFTIGGDDSDEEDSSPTQHDRAEIHRPDASGGLYDDPLRDGRMAEHPGSAPIETTDRMPGSYDFDRDFVSDTISSTISSTG